MKRLLLSFCLLLTSQVGGANPKVPEVELRGEVRKDLPAPATLQAVVLNKTVTLSWDWQPPEISPIFLDFGYEVKRHDGKSAVISGTTWSDFDLAFGTYSYTVRVRGGAKERRKRVNHISDWSEPVEVAIRVTCPRPPAVELSVEPTKRTYSSIPALRLHLTGRATVEPGCHLARVTYHIDSGTGIQRTGPLSVDSDGRFDAFVEALQPDDDVPVGSAAFTITASAENEAGPTTSSAYSINVNLRNPYAPHAD